MTLDFFNLYFSFLFFILGSGLGSFFNVVLERTHEDENWIIGRSKCESCGEKLKAIDLIPLLSFLFLRGKCRYCKTQLDSQYFIFELVGGLLSLLLFWVYKNNPVELFLILPIFFLLLIIFVSDLKYMEIPDYFSIPLALLILLNNLIFSNSLFMNHLIAGLIGGLFFLLLFIITKGKGIGDGDIRLGLIMGLILGLPDIMTSIFIGFIFGSIIALPLLFTKKATKKTPLPLGVFLIPSLLLFFFFSDYLNSLPFIGVYNELYLLLIQ